MRDRSSGRDDRRSRAPEALNNGFAYASTASGHQRALAGEFGFGESTHPRLLLRLPTAAKGRVAGPARTSARRILPRSNDPTPDRSRQPPPAKDSSRRRSGSSTLARHDTALSRLADPPRQGREGPALPAAAHARSHRVLRHVVLAGCE